MPPSARTASISSLSAPARAGGQPPSSRRRSRSSRGVPPARVTAGRSAPAWSRTTPRRRSRRRSRSEGPSGERRPSVWTKPSVSCGNPTGVRTLARPTPRTARRTPLAPMAPRPDDRVKRVRSRANRRASPVRATVPSRRPRRERAVAGRRANHHEMRAARRRSASPIGFVGGHDLLRRALGAQLTLFEPDGSTT